MNNRICDLFGIRYPVISGGMVWCSGWELASAVSNAGGLGLIGAGSMHPEVLREHIRKCKAATDKPFGVNVPLLYPEMETIIQIIIEEKVPVVFTSAGNPKTWTAKLKEQGIKVDEKEGFPYLIAVNRAASTVTVYTLDEEGRYTVPYMAMVCSGGEDTPLGFFATPVSYDWRLLAGPSYGQYATRIWDAYLFHSVPYYSQHKDDVEYDQFNELGTPASLGCIRLMVNDVKWIYDNCDIGTRVIIYDDAEDPGPMGKPGTIYTDPADETLRGWDPTDPDPENPWDDKYLSGTTIRSEAAWDEWNAAQEDGRWNTSLTPTDLQGWSTDSSVEGTRG